MTENGLFKYYSTHLKPVRVHISVAKKGILVQPDFLKWRVGQGPFFLTVTQPETKSGNLTIRSEGGRAISKQEFRSSLGSVLNLAFRPGATVGNLQTQKCPNIQAGLILKLKLKQAEA